MKINKYILDGKKVVACNDLMVWAKWHSTADRIVAKTTTKNGDVSTVFLGLNHQFREGPPLVFETMVFGGSLDGEMDRYSTWKEAEKGHKAMVEKVAKEDTMNEITKGPWIFETTPSGNILIKAKLMEFRSKEPLDFFVLPANKDISFQMNDKNELWGCIAYDQWVQFYHPESWKNKQQANARAISLVPDMVEALEYALESLKEGAPVEQISDCMMQIQDLLTKLKGGE